MNDWISVEDRLPEASYSAQGYSYGKFASTYLGEVCYSDGEWIVFNENKNTLKVTHWQEIPSPLQEWLDE